MLATTWAQVKIGPLLRREADLRTYHNLFRHRPDEITGLRRLWLRASVTEREEPTNLENRPDVSGSETVIVRFDGWRDCFQPLNGWDEWLAQELRAITRRRWLQEADSVPIVPVAINVRCGDFAVPKNPKELCTRAGVRTPLSWFIDSLHAIRQAAGADLAAYVVSDGTDQELGPLLACNNVFRVRPGSAISGLLFLARARVLIGAGGSSFSAWASFLGQMPTISHLGKSLAGFKLRNRRGFYLGEFDPANPNPAFLDEAAWLLTSSACS
jgi:hypothetical protein